MDVFDYDSVISDLDIAAKRSQNLEKFMNRYIYDVIIKNIDLETRF